MDVERKRHFGFDASARTGSSVDGGIYAREASVAVYRKVAGLADVVCSAGYPAVVDAAFLHRWQRDLFRTTAERAGVPFVIADVSAAEATLRRRVAQRSADGRDASEAGPAVIERQLASHDALEADERAGTLVLDGELPVEDAVRSPAWQRLVALLQASRDAPAPAPATPPSTMETVRFLSRPSTYPAASPVDVVETHLSWVFLTDEHAWKLKKPLRQNGIDLVTLAARRHNAERELRLNRRLSSGVYLDVVPVVARDGALALGGKGEPVDWLVRMRRLPARRMLDAMIRDRTVEASDVRALLGTLVAYYRRARVPVLSGGEYRRHLQRAIGETHAALCWPGYRLDRARIDRIAARLQGNLDRHAALLERRMQRGHVVDAHGDLRPEHVCIDRVPQVIDCLDFDAILRLQDTADELGFLALECERLGAAALREAIFATYTAITDDEPPDALVHFYQAYRAFVRARLAIRHVDDAGVREPERWRAQAEDYLRLAEAHIDRGE
jgi:aminoglycoside phosphotransferase family enzyme/predicted kinase